MLKHDEILGPFDGVQTEFSTVLDYVPGSLRAFTPLLGEAASVTELGGKDARLDDAPLEGDVLIFVYNTL